ncbi:unnamed protein product, partial [Prunus brigantina]
VERQPPTTLLSTSSPANPTSQNHSHCQFLTLQAHSPLLPPHLIIFQTIQTTQTLSPHPQPTTPNPSIHQKFLQKLLEPSSDIPEPSSSNPPSKFMPLEHQVVDLRKRYPDVLLMVEVGYKYQFFGQDAENVARVLGIYSHMDHNFLTACVPTFRLNVHVRRLVSAGPYRCSTKESLNGGHWNHNREENKRRPALNQDGMCALVKMVQRDDVGHKRCMGTLGSTMIGSGIHIV